MDNKTGGKILTDKLEIDYLWNYKENNFKLLTVILLINIMYLVKKITWVKVKNCKICNNFHTKKKEKYLRIIYCYAII